MAPNTPTSEKTPVEHEQAAGSAETTASPSQTTEPALSKTEAHARLSRWARGSIAPFLRVGEAGQVYIDLSTEQAQNNYHLLRRVVERRYTTQTAQGAVEVVETEIELYSALDAVHRILQLHGSYAPVKYDHTTNGKDWPAPAAGQELTLVKSSEGSPRRNPSNRYGTQKESGKADNNRR